MNTGDREPNDYEERMKWQFPYREQRWWEFTPSGMRITSSSLPEGYHGRFELLTLEDFCFLNACGISVL